MNQEQVAMLTPLVLAVAGLVIQYLQKKDTNKHGDEYIKMLKQAGDTFGKMAIVFPQLQTPVGEYNMVVAEAEKIWNTGGFTAEDMKFVGEKAAFYKTLIDQELAKIRNLKAQAPVTPA